MAITQLIAFTRGEDLAKYVASCQATRVTYAPDEDTIENYS